MRRSVARIVCDARLELRDLVDDHEGLVPIDDPFNLEVFMARRNRESIVLLAHPLVVGEHHGDACVACGAGSALAQEIEQLVVVCPSDAGLFVHLREPLVDLSVKGFVPSLARSATLHGVEFTQSKFAGYCSDKHGSTDHGIQSGCE